MYDNYPPGMSKADLMHVGEIEDPYEDFYENYEPTKDQLEDFLADNSEELLKLLIKFENVSYDDIVLWWKEENENIIEFAFEDRD